MNSWIDNSYSAWANSLNEEQGVILKFLNIKLKKTWCVLDCG